MCDPRSSVTSSATGWVLPSTKAVAPALYVGRQMTGMATNPCLWHRWGNDCTIRVGPSKYVQKVSGEDLSQSGQDKMLILNM